MSVQTDLLARGVFGSRPAFGIDGRRYIATDTGVEYYDTGAAWVALGGALSHSTNQLGADVTMTSTNTFYDGPSLSLAAGTWLLLASIYVLSGTTASNAEITAKLWDGTTAAASAFMTIPGTNYATQLALSAVVSPGTTTTYKVSAARDGGTGTWAIMAAASANAAGNTASSLVAVRIG